MDENVTAANTYLCDLIYNLQATHDDMDCVVAAFCACERQHLHHS